MAQALLCCAGWFGRVFLLFCLLGFCFYIKIKIKTKIKKWKVYKEAVSEELMDLSGPSCRCRVLLQVPKSLIPWSALTAQQNAKLAEGKDVYGGSKANILGHSKCIKGKRLMNVPDRTHWVLRSNRRFLENVPTGETAQGRAVPVHPGSGGSSFLPAAGRSRGNGIAVTSMCHLPSARRAALFQHLHRGCGGYFSYLRAASGILFSSHNWWSNGKKSWRNVPKGCS